MFNFKEKLKFKLQSFAKDAIFDINYWETIEYSTEYSEQQAGLARTRLDCFNHCLKAFEEVISDEEFHNQNNKHLDKMIDLIGELDKQITKK